MGKYNLTEKGKKQKIKNWGNGLLGKKHSEETRIKMKRIGVMVHPHHIKPLALYPELVFKVDNGITYCAEFHIKSHLHQGIQKELMQKES